MDVVVLVGVCGAGLLAAAAAVVRWGGLVPGPRPLVADEATMVTLRRLLRSLSIAFLAGGLAGLLTAGLGGRLMMRILAATSSERVQGFPTDAEETVGEITFGGSASFVLFTGVTGGLLGATVYFAVRRWLPGRSARTSGLLLGLLALGLAPVTDALNQDNRDFTILDPDPLAVALIVGIFLLGGMTVVSVVERADRSWPVLEGRPSLATVAAYAPLLLFIPGWFVLVVFVGVLGGTVAVQRVAPLHRAWTSAPVDRLGRVAFAALTLAAVAWAGSHAIDILTGDDLFAVASVPGDSAAE